MAVGVWRWCLIYDGLERRDYFGEFGKELDFRISDTESALIAMELVKGATDEGTSR